MFRKKVYGSYKVELCPFCSKTSTTKNGQGISVCQRHKKAELLDLKCACGDWLDLKVGKYGPYFSCFKCGIVKYQKGLEINDYPIISIEDL